MTITLWQFVTGDWAGHHFGPIQIIAIGLVGLEIPVVLVLWGMAILRVLGVTGPKQLSEPILTPVSRHATRPAAQPSPPAGSEYSTLLAALTPQSGARVGQH